MYIDPVRHSGRPTDDRIPQEMAIYDELERQGISFERVDHDHADTMEDCRKIEEVLDAKICKNLFLCNRQQTEFYLLIMPGEKPFKTKYLSAQLGCSEGVGDESTANASLRAPAIYTVTTVSSASNLVPLLTSHFTTQFSAYWPSFSMICML